MTVQGLQLGAPGIYRTARRVVPALRPERLDVAGFVGVAPRGPVDEPVVVDSWGEYRWRFGDDEGPGLLPYAVRAFFAQGGTRAHVLRVSPLPRLPDPAAAAAHSRHELRLGAVDGTMNQPTAATTIVSLLARDEGEWGRRLTIGWDFDSARRFTSTVREDALDLPDGVTTPAFSLVRLRGTGLPVAGAFAWTRAVELRDDGPSRRRPVAPLEAGTAPLDGTARQLEVTVVTVTVTVTDTDPRLRREERFGDLGLRRGHPRYVADVLADESRLVRPAPDWPAAVVPPDPLLAPVVSVVAAGQPGQDRWAGITAASLFGDQDPQLLPVGGVEGLDDVDAVRGVDRLALEQEIGLLAVPDLFWAFAQPAAVPDVPQTRPRTVFEPCSPDPPVTTDPPAPEAVLLDGRTELDEILRRQRRLVAHAERQRRFVVLLDVPQHLPARRIARWRAEFNSSYAAAYHPWLGVVSPQDPRRPRVTVPPSAFAAGIIAERENRLGLPWGPANEVAVDAVLSVEPVTDADHDTLHGLGVDVFRAERDGLRLTSARTLSLDPDYRQLSVRRLVTMLHLVLQRQLQWMVFEPHSAQLRRLVRDVAVQLLRQLFQGGAFAGATEDESFFVRCDETLNPAWSFEQGRLVAEIGVAPAYPLEYIVVRVAQNADGGLAVEAP